METSYKVVSVDAKVRRWLEEVQLPRPTSTGNFPTFDQIQQAIEGLPDYTVTYATNDSPWRAELFHRQDLQTVVGSIRVVPTEGDSGLLEINVSTMYPELAIDISRRLAEVSGPLLLERGEGETPWVIEAESNIWYM